MTREELKQWYGIDTLKASDLCFCNCCCNYEDRTIQGRLECTCKQYPNVWSEFDERQLVWVATLTGHPELAGVLTSTREAIEALFEAEVKL